MNATGKRVRRATLEAFLALLAEGHTVKYSAKEAGVAWCVIFARRNNDPVFAEQWEEALERGTQVLEEEARRRAVKGLTEPVFYKGEICGEVQRYSDVLLIFLLKARRPEVYRERFDVSGKVEHTVITIDAVDAEIARLSAEVNAKAEKAEA